MTAFRMPPRPFVATATAIGLLVDIARTPVYLWSAGSILELPWAMVWMATAGVLTGTILGERILFGLSPRRFGQSVAVAIGLLGVWLLLKPE